MSNAINSLAALKDAANASKQSNETPTFRAPNLKVTVTREDTGEAIGEYILESRGFKPSGKDQVSGMGWYDSPGQSKRDDGGEFQGHALSCAFRLSLKGIKVKPDVTVDLTGDDS